MPNPNAIVGIVTRLDPPVDRVSPQTWWYATDPADGNVVGQDFND